MFSSIVKIYQRLSQEDDMTLWQFLKALYILSTFESNRLVVDDYKPVPKRITQCILYYWRFCEPSLGKLRYLDNMWHYFTHDNDELARHYCEIIHKDDLLYSFWGNEPLFPGNFAFINHEANTIVWVIRPTLSTEDVMVDLLADSVEFMGGYAHQGMVMSAHNMLDKVFPIIEKALVAYETYDLVICGHSLGAGMATILSMLLYPRYNVAALAFACPPCISADLARKSQTHVMSIVIGDDIISRLSYHAFALFKKRLYLISHLGGEDALRDMNIISNMSWVHEDHMNDPTRLWGPIRTILIHPGHIVVAKEVSSFVLHSIIVSRASIVNHSPLKYIGLFRQWYLQTYIEIDV